MKYTRLRTVCPFCQSEHDSTTLAIGENCKPKNGDCTICFRCGEWMFFAKGQKGGLRKPTWKEYQQLVKRPDAVHVRAAWLHVKQQQQHEQQDQQMTTKDEVTIETWMTEACRYAKHIWCYEGLVTEFPEAAEAAFRAGVDVYEYVKSFGEKYDLDRADLDWGINYNVPFEKKLERAKVGG